MSKIKFKSTPESVILRVKLMDSDSTTGAGLTGLTFSSAGLIIAVAKIGDATTTAYTQAGGTIETIATLGTYAAPTATKCRFKEYDSTNHKGVYEIQIADARFASTTQVLISISGAAELAEYDAEVDMETVNSNLTEIGADTQSATDLKDFADDGYDPSANKVNGVALVDVTTENSDMRGTDGAALAIVCTEARLEELDAGNIPADLTNIEADTDDIQTQIGTAGAGLTDLGGMSTGMKTEVKVEAKAVIYTDTLTELAQGVPDAEPTVADAVMLPYMALRNYGDHNRSTKFGGVYNNAGVRITKQTIDDDGTDFTKTQMVSGA